MTKIQNRRNGHVTSIKLSGCFGYWNFGFGYYLGFEIWDFSFFFRQANCCYLSQLESTLTFPYGSEVPGFHYSMWVAQIRMPLESLQIQKVSGIPKR